MRPIQLQLSVVLNDEGVAALAELLARAIKLAAPHLPLAAEPTGPNSAALSLKDRCEEPALLINSREAAKLLKVSDRKLWTMWHSGEMPAPGKIGHAVRWSYDELRAWVNAGCPPQAAWKWPK